MLLNPAIERLPRPRLRAVPNECLREQVAYAQARVPFYQPRLAAAGLTPATCRGQQQRVGPTPAPGL